MSKYILYGTGHDGIIAMRYLGRENILFFCNSTDYGSKIEGIPVVGIEKLKQRQEEGIVVIAVSKPKYLLEISKLLISLNIDFVFWEDIVTDIIHKEGFEYEKINKRGCFQYDAHDEYIVIPDRFEKAGILDSYLWQDLWAARLIYDHKPVAHYDIGSRVDGFITHLLSFNQRVIQLDIRPLEVNVNGYGFVQTDATELKEIEDNSIESLSALCSLEHFGLGRYGDPIDPEACFKCFDSIQRVLCRGGYAYISVPIGREHLEFNAHRVFFPKTIVDSFREMDLIEFSSCYGNQIERNIGLHQYDDWDEHGGRRFGLFLFKKR